MIHAIPPPALTPKPIVRISVACHAVSISAMIKLDGKTYRLGTIEVCGNKVVIRGKAVR